MVYYVIKDRFKRYETPEQTTTDLTDPEIIFKTYDKDEAINEFKSYYVYDKHRYKLFEVTTETIEGDL